MSARPSMPLIQFGKYLLDGEIATGGMSKVYRARLRGPGGFEKRLVVKQILPHLAQDPNFVRMFVQEANTLVQMSHPNIVPVYELGVVDGVYFLAMELLEGATLSELLRDGPLPEPMVAYLGVQLCDALHYAHDRFRVIHRDVTPRNLVIDDSGHARLLDFGIAAPADETGRFGSAGYMSPEQAQGLPVGPQSDLFSVGTLLYEALCGQPAFLRATVEDSRRALLEEPVPVLAPNVASEELRQWVARCLVRDVSKRPESAAEVAKGLRQWLARNHPAGVAEELGSRARAARARRQVSDERPEPGTDALEATPRTSEPDGNARGANKILATSPIFESLLQQVTEPIPRVADSANAQNATPQAARAKSSSAVAVAVTVALAAALSLVVLVVWMLWPASSAPAVVPQPSAVASEPTVEMPAETPADPSRVEIDGPVAEQAVQSPPELPTNAETPPVTVPDEADNAARASLVVNAMPWAEVRIKGRLLGTTPLRNVSVSAGKQVLELNCPPLGRTARVTVQPKAGQTLKVLVDLNQDPASVSVE